MSDQVDRNYFIDLGAAVAAQCLYDVHEGRGDTSMVEVNGKMKMKPYLPVLELVKGKPEARNTSISDDNGNTIYLSVTEEEDLQIRTNHHLAQLVYSKVKGKGADTPAILFEAAKDLIDRAKAIGSVVLVGMNTAKQQQINKSRDFVIVAPYNGQGQTLMHPEPSTTGQKYGG